MAVVATTVDDRAATVTDEVVAAVRARANMMAEGCGYSIAGFCFVATAKKKIGVKNQNFFRFFPQISLSW